MGHVHDAPLHEGAGAEVEAEHVGDDDLGEIDVGDGGEAGVVDELGESGVAAAGDEDVGGGGGRGGEVWQEGGAKGGPVGVPLEGSIRGSDGEEPVPVLLQREVA